MSDPVSGGLKKGPVVVLPRGKAVKLTTVEVLFGPTAGAGVQIMVGNNNALSPGALANFTTVATATGIPGNDFTFHASGSATGRYVLIWLTKLPPRPESPKHNFEAEIFNVVVRGSG